MVPVAPAGRLTKIGFRRDVRLFLAALVGFLVVLILALLVLLQQFLLTTEESIRGEWETMADAAKETIDQMPAGSGEGGLEGRLAYLRGTYSLVALELKRPGLPPLVSGSPPAPGRGEKVERATAAGTAVFWFDSGPLASMHQTFRRTALITIIATVAGTILLILYLPRIVRPVEEMLDQARALGERAEGEDESRYLIDTFRNSIATLKRQEAELVRLHDLEKSRADDLERMTATLTRSLTSGFIALDDNGAVVDANRAAREILGIAAAAAVAGLPLKDAFGTTPFTARLEEAFAGRLAVAREEIELGGDTTIGLTTVPLTGEESRFLGLLALFTDLTPIRTLEDRLRAMQSLADLGEMSAGIAHEFRNSLSTILGYLKLARRQQLPEEVQGRIRSAEEEASLLATAVEGLLSFARPMKLERRRVELGALLEETAERLRVRDDARFQIEGGPLELEADPVLLGRALENILRNAVESIRAKGGRGQIMARLSREPSPRLVVTDDGAGLDPADAPRFFLPFQSTKSTGMGLGLALTRKIVLLHGGTIELTGEPGKGAATTIELP